MADQTHIEWCDSTFNPWEGCQKVGPGCDHCYAETRNARFGGGVAPNWGPGAPRRRTSPANWLKPLRWQADAARFLAEHDRRQRVFCASLADVFDNAADPADRADLFALIRRTPDLDWLLLTKRIGNAAAMAEAAGGWPANVWLGATVVNQAEADRDVPKLLATAGPRVRFLSMEPLLGSVDLRGYIRGTGDRRAWSAWRWPSWVPERVSVRIEEFWRAEYGRGVDAWIRGAINNGQPPLGSLGDYTLCQPGSPKVTGRFIPCWNNIGAAIDADGQSHTVAEGIYQGRPSYIDWVIVGGESGPGARPMHPDWARRLRDQCAAAGVPLLFKQWGEWAPGENSPNTVNQREVRTADWFDGKWLFETMHGNVELHADDEPTLFWAGKKAAGRLLDGVQHDGVPTC